MQKRRVRKPIPCMYCGEAGRKVALYKAIPMNRGRGPVTYYVKCETCGAQGSDTETTPNGAVDVWNHDKPATPKRIRKSPDAD